MSKRAKRFNMDAKQISDIGLLNHAIEEKFKKLLTGRF